MVEIELLDVIYIMLYKKLKFLTLKFYFRCTFLPKVKVNGINIYYEMYGEGFPLLMIMGLGADLTWWDPEIINSFSKKFKVIVFDNRGAGRSDKPPGEYSIKMFAEDTYGLMKALGIDKAHVLGVSMGGMIAQELAISHPEAVEKLVLVVTTPGGPRSVPPRPEALAALTMNRRGMKPEEIARKTVESLFPKEYLERNRELAKELVRRITKYPIPPDAYERQLRAVMNFDAYDRLHLIRSSTLIIAGGKDIIVPPENGRILAERIPNSKLVIFENSGHGLIVQERERFIKLVLDFLTS